MKLIIHVKKIIFVLSSGCASKFLFCQRYKLVGICPLFCALPGPMCLPPPPSPLGPADWPVPIAATWGCKKRTYFLLICKKIAQFSGEFDGTIDLLFMKISLIGQALLPTCLPTSPRARPPPHVPAHLPTCLPTSPRACTPPHVPAPSASLITLSLAAENADSAPTGGVHECPRQTHGPGTRVTTQTLSSKETTNIETTNMDAKKKQFRNSPNQLPVSCPLLSFVLCTVPWPALAPV